MGIMPPYDPFDDAALRWAVARVVRCEPATATWGRPALVELAVLEPLRGELPGTVEVLFDAPREAAQARFYAMRGATPDEAARHLAALDAQPVPLPPTGATIIVWLAPPSPPPALPGPPLPSGPVPVPPGVPALPPTPEGGWWSIPTPRTFGASAIPLEPRWIAIAHLPAVRARLAR
jgi:hypothetical protein